MTYNSPKEFAEIIKKELYQYSAEPEDLELRKAAVQRQYADEIKNSAFEIDQQYNSVNTGFQEVIDLIIEEFFSILPDQVVTNFKTHFYFTTIENRTINASVRRSSDHQYFGIFINSALINLLTKLGKLDQAVTNPECIVFCNRFPDSKPSVEEIKLMRNEMYQYFTTEKMAFGPYLIIKGIEQQSHFNKLNIQEKLIIFHEIGHFLNGDLFKGKEVQAVKKGFANISHQREFHADLVGFGLLLMLEKKDGTLILERRLDILFAIIALFDVMYGLQGVETDSYPHPLDRLMFLIENFYGAQFAEIVHKTYSDGNEFQKLMPDVCPPIDSVENTVEDYINQALVEAFNESSW